MNIQLPKDQKHRKSRQCKRAAKNFESVIVIYGCPLTNYTCGLKSKNALCSKKTRRTAKLNQSKKSIKLKKTNELRQNLKQLGSIVSSKK